METVMFSAGSIVSMEPKKASTTRGLESVQGLAGWGASGEQVKAASLAGPCPLGVEPSCTPQTALLSLQFLGLVSVSPLCPCLLTPGTRKECASRGLAGPWGAEQCPMDRFFLELGGHVICILERSPP